MKYDLRPRTRHELGQAPPVSDVAGRAGDCEVERLPVVRLGGFQGEPVNVCAELAQPQRKPGTLEPRVAGDQHATPLVDAAEPTKRAARSQAHLTNSSRELCRSPRVCSE